MSITQPQPPLPGPDLDHLAPIEPGLPILAFLAVSGHGSSSRDAVEKALLALYADPSLFGTALSGLADEGLIWLSKSGRCRITDSGRARAEGKIGKLIGRSWPNIVSRALSVLALGIDPRSEKARDYLARRENLECAALARLYGLSGLGTMPTRPQVRFALLRAMIASRLPECEPAFTEISMHNTSRDALGRAVMLGAAGLKRGALRDAESVLLRKALGLRPEASGGVAEALIRSGIAKGSAPRPAPVVLVKTERRSDAPDLAEFAATVRDLAKTLRTDPFAGRVAIAQVYDAGTMRGLNFGSLDGFKASVAEAGRAGLIDLERYDIAGPMDTALRDRSRIAFGRDERHFIVNEWI